MKLNIVCIFILGIFIPGFCLAQANETNKNQDINVVYGERHIFTIETPQEWINDKKYAEQIGLVNFFYASADSSVKQKSYMYAMGYDKDRLNSGLEEFIQGDLESYRKKYPGFISEKGNIQFTGGVKNGKLYSFSNLNDRYAEEVLYAETESTIIVFVFSATTENNYLNYQSVFDLFIQSFNYRGNDPKPFLDYMKKNRRIFK